MQLGSRWSVGGTAPRSLPESIVAEMRAVETQLSEDEARTLRWTLTWLEGRPILELDNGVRIEG